MSDEQIGGDQIYHYEWLPPDHRHCRGCGAVVVPTRVLCVACDETRDRGGGG
jgi:hypothetical protein